MAAAAAEVAQRVSDTVLLCLFCKMCQATYLQQLGPYYDLLL